MLSLWWLGLHLLLAVTALLIGWGPVPKIAAIVAVIAHASWRRPLAASAEIAVGADGACRVASEGSEPFVPGPRTLLTPFWLRIVAGNQRDGVDILLLADQLDLEDWRRLTAIMRRAIAR